MSNLKHSENSHGASIWDTVVIGGGPAGLMAAGIAAKFGAKTLLIEKNDVMGKKLLLTGGGRCNLTNADPDERNFVSKFGKKGNFLFSPLSVFGTDDTIRFFEGLGLKTKVEAGFRSTGDGLKWLKEIGHKVVEVNPSLVPIKLKEPWIGELAGITLENVGVSIWSLKEGADLSDWKKVLGKKGRILFTHVGLSGPTILNMSKTIGDLLERDNKVRIAIDFFPGVGLDIMHEKILKLFESNPKKKIKNLLLPEVPEKIYLKMLELMGMDGEWFANEIKKAERMAIVDMLKRFEFKVDSLLGYDKAIVSSGGVDLNEVDFKEMKSKLFDNLFLVGDILDFDRSSGGYSLQLCWTTGYVAGKSAANNLK